MSNFLSQSVNTTVLIGAIIATMCRHILYMYVTIGAMDIKSTSEEQATNYNTWLWSNKLQTLVAMSLLTTVSRVLKCIHTWSWIQCR